MTSAKFGEGSVSPQVRVMSGASNGFLYLVAIMDWASRKILSWRLSKTMHADFCVDAVNEVIAKHGRLRS